MICGCHGKPAYWNTDSRYAAGGFWRCAVKKLDQQRLRYDTDPIHRIEKNLRRNAVKRRKTIERRRAAHPEQGSE